MTPSRQGNDMPHINVNKQRCHVSAAEMVCVMMPQGTPVRYQVRECGLLGWRRVSGIGVFQMVTFYDGVVGIIKVGKKTITAFPEFGDRIKRIKPPRGRLFSDGEGI